MASTSNCGDVSVGDEGDALERVGEGNERERLSRDDRLLVLDPCLCRDGGGSGTRTLCGGEKWTPGTWDMGYAHRVPSLCE